MCGEVLKNITDLMSPLKHPYTNTHSRAHIWQNALTVVTKNSVHQDQQVLFIYY